MVIHRRREKPLTPAQAIELAKKEAFPYWFGSEPLMAGVKAATGGARAYPLDSKMVEKPWLLFFIRPFALSTREILSYAHEWSTRYEAQKLGTMIILRLSYSFSRDTDWVRKFASHHATSFVTVMDKDDALAEAFEASKPPKILHLVKNQSVFERSGKEWFAGTELELQKVFRKADPGLPLFPVLERTDPVTQDKDSVELGNWPEAEKDVQLTGKWTYEKERVETFDPTATLSFNCTGKKVGVVAQKIQSTEPGRSSAEGAEIVVELPRDFPADPIHGEDLMIDLSIMNNPLVDPIQKKQARLNVDEPRLYHLFKKLPITHREVTLRFPSAEKAGVAIYGLRFGD